MTDETICETFYKKLNSFVTNVINRDVIPKIDGLRDGKADNYHTQYTTTVKQSNALSNLGTNANASQSVINSKINEKLGYWTTLSNTESYVTTKADIITTNAWVTDGLNGETVTQTSVTAPQSDNFAYINNTNKKIQITLTWVSGSFVIDGNNYLRTTGDELTYTLNPNQSISVISQTSSTLNYTVGTQSNIISSIINVAYPVGSIYISSSIIHPSITFGGVWEHFAEDKFLLSAGSTYSNGTTGGSATVTLTKDEMPSHTHTQNAHTHNGASGRAFVTDVEGKGINESRFTAVSSGSTYTVRFESGDNWWGVNNVGNTTATNQNTGGGKAHNNMPPYLAVYMWKRVG